MTPTIFPQPDTFADEGRKYYMEPSKDGFFFGTASPGRSWGEFENMSVPISAADVTEIQEIIFVGSVQPKCVKAQFKIKSVKGVSLSAKSNFFFEFFCNQNNLL